MALERKDLRLKLDPDDHAGLALLAEADEMELGAWAERVLISVIRRRVHAALILSTKARKLGIDGKPIPAEE